MAMVINTPSSKPMMKMYKSVSPLLVSAFSISGLSASVGIVVDSMSSIFIEGDVLGCNVVVGMYVEDRVGAIGFIVGEDEGIGVGSRVGSVCGGMG